MTEAPPATRSFIESLPIQDLEGFFKTCAEFGDYLYKTNETFNLTAIPPEQYWTKHVADSASLSLAIPKLATAGYELGDLGCGAGFPSLILAAAFPRLRVTAIDSTLKKVEFVKRAATLLGLRNLSTIHGRANELGRQKLWKRRFSVVTARAVSGLPTIIRESEGILSDAGIVAVYRTPKQADEELQALESSKEISGDWDIAPTEPFELPDGDAGERLFLLCAR